MDTGCMGMIKIQLNLLITRPQYNKSYSSIQSASFVEGAPSIIQGQMTIDHQRSLTAASYSRIRTFPSYNRPPFKYKLHINERRADYHRK